MSSAGLRAPPAIAASTANAKSTSLNVTVNGSKDWVDTGMEVQAGDKLHITAKGTVTMGNQHRHNRRWRGARMDRHVACADGAERRPRRAGGTRRQQRRRDAILHRRGWNDASAYRGQALSRHQSRTPCRRRTASTRSTSIAPRPALRQPSGAAASQSKYDFKPLFAELDAKLPYRVTDQAAGRQSGRPGQLRHRGNAGAGDQTR